MNTGASLVTTARSTPEGLIPMQPQSTTCSISDCNNRRKRHGWCEKHHARWLRHGDPFVTLRPELEQSEAERFSAKVDRSDEDGCWLWTGTRTRDGYGRFRVGGEMVYAHRWAYEDAHGPIPAGLTLDHLCRTRACVRLLHLEPVTRRENILRGVGAPAQNARKTHCKHGHKFTPENTHARSDGGRRCRECRRTRSTARMPA